MEIESAKTELICRTLDWSTRDFAQEIAADFPILTTYGLHNRYILGFAVWFRTLDQDMHASVKLMLPQWGLGTGLPLIGKKLSEEVKSVYFSTYKGATLVCQNLPPLTSANENAPGFVRIDKYKMLVYIEKHLAPIFGKPKSKRGLTLKYLNRYGDWSISTKISLGSRWASEARYEFSVQRKDYAKSGLQAISDLRPFWRRTLIGLWGINGSEWWSIPSQQDIEPVTKSLVAVCGHFMKGFPPLLAGLNCDD